LAVAPNGKLWAQREQPGTALTQRLADHPQPDFIPVYRPFEDPVPPDAPKLDLITIVNNYHDITYMTVDRAKMNQRLFAALKPGGYLVIVDHSAKPGTGTSVGKTLHRIDEAVVVSELKAAGFALDAEGQFLRNPGDTRDFSSGDGRMATDKFVLRFVKPK
jgi:predicted methyltransferase